MDRLTITEEILLLAIFRLKEDAYGVNIRQLYCDYTGKDVSFGTMYNNLSQLVKKGYVNSFKGEPTSIRGGKRKVYYQITKVGVEALQAAKELHTRLWEGLTDLAVKSNK